MNYHAPGTVAEAISLLDDHPTAKVFAGATDLVPQLRAGRPAPEALIDLKKIDRLIGITHHDHTWTIGAATPTVLLTEHADLTAQFPGLVEAAGLIGSDQIQSRSSLGGNLCNASPAADSVPAMLINDMRAVIAGPSGERVVPVADIATGPGQTSLAHNEILVEFQLDDPAPNTSDAYLRMIPRTEMDIAVVGAGARLTLADDGTVASAAIALGAVAPTAFRLTQAEEALVGSPVTDDALAAAASVASAATNPIDDKRGTIAYRRHVAGVLTKRAITTAAQRAQQQSSNGGRA